MPAGLESLSCPGPWGGCTRARLLAGHPPALLSGLGSGRRQLQAAGGQGPASSWIPWLRSLPGGAGRALFRCWPASDARLWFGIVRLAVAADPFRALRFSSAASRRPAGGVRCESAGPGSDASWISLHGREPETLGRRLHSTAKRRPVTPLIRAGGGGEEGAPNSCGFAWKRPYLRLALRTRLGPKFRRRGVWRPGGGGGLSRRSSTRCMSVVLIAETPTPPDPGEALPLFGLDAGLWLQHPDRALG